MKKTFKHWIGSESFENGQRIESEFGRLLKARYPEAREATLEEQFKHIDWVCDKGSIDVKAMKAVSRGEQPQIKLVWLEFKNKVGDLGWLYGEQDYIAFEYPLEYRIVKRAALAEMAEMVCDVDDMVTSAREAIYKGYTRKGMQDLLSMIYTSDLMLLHPEYIPKDEIRD